MAEKPVPQPTYVLRGHNAQVHAVAFLQQNTKLATGDAEGWLIVWDLAIRRPTAVWRAHSNTILGLAGFDDDKILTHGRDNKIKLWDLPSGRSPGHSNLSTTLPVDDPTSERPQPRLLQTFYVNSLNFCSFASCPLPTPIPVSTLSSSSTSAAQHDTAQHGDDHTLVAVPGLQDGMINIMALPSGQRFATLPPLPVKSAEAVPGNGTGTVMAIGLYYHHNERLQVMAGYENGEAALWHQDSRSKAWKAIYRSKPHSQPVLSLDCAVESGAWFTSSADAILARHPLNPYGDVPEGSLQTKHAGQQSLTVRQDGRIFATSGWDGRVRVYSVEEMTELAVLKWHKEACYSVAFADILSATARDDDRDQVAARRLTVAQQRKEKTQNTHWIAVGSKDGKVSLWDIY